MDAKTMDYLGKRVDEARRITGVITALKRERDNLSSRTIDSLSYGDRSYIHTVSHFRAELTAATLVCMDNAIAKNEALLAEL